MNDYRIYNCTIIIGNKESYSSVKANYMKIDDKTISFYRIDENTGKHNLHALYPINNIIINSVLYPENEYDDVDKLFVSTKG